MATTLTYEAFRRSQGNVPLTIEKVTETLSTDLKTEEVLIHIRAVSLNYRDAAMLKGNYPSPCMPQGVPSSDCAAEVVKIGPGAQKFKIGDRVQPVFGHDFLTGDTN